MQRWPLRGRGTSTDCRPSYDDWMQRCVQHRRSSIILLHSTIVTSINTLSYCWYCFYCWALTLAGTWHPSVRSTIVFCFCFWTRGGSQSTFNFSFFFLVAVSTPTSVTDINHCLSSQRQPPISAPTSVYWCHRDSSQHQRRYQPHQHRYR